MKYCKNCGHEVGPTDKICPNCGWDFKSKIETKLYGSGSVSSNAVIFSILSIILGLLPFIGIPLALIGIVMAKKNLETKVMLRVLLDSLFQLLRLLYGSFLEHNNNLNIEVQNVV